MNPKSSLLRAIKTFVLLLLPLSPIAADIAHYVQLEEQNIQTGHLVSFIDDHYELSTKQYDSSMVGVINTTPAAAINTVGHDKSYPLVNNSTAYVLVNSSNGPIAIGDAITSSNEPGVGMKADRPGIIVGRAQEAFSSDNPDEVKAISAILIFKWADISDSLSPDRPLTKQLIDRIGYGFRLSTIAALDEPSTALRYTLAILVLLFSFIFGFLVFGRVAAHGVSAIGRNPLARRSINLAIIINVLITVAITASGLVVAVLLLTF